MARSAKDVIEGVWLSRRVTVKRYRDLEVNQDRAGIAKFIHDRFAERYLLPLRAVEKGEESGFLMMASCCLLIEGLTAFREGWPTTKDRSLNAFQRFFRQAKDFQAFRGYERDFWVGVRCGILHQGETKGGWKLNFSRRSEELFVASTLTVNCHKFLDLLEHELSKYREQLERSNWDDRVWQNLRTKMAATIQDCEAER